MGVGWWLLNETALLRQTMEAVAKQAFTKASDPMDAAVYYLAMSKKNVLAHLFKLVTHLAIPHSQVGRRHPHGIVLLQRLCQARVEEGGDEERVRAARQAALRAGGGPLPRGRLAGRRRAGGRVSPCLILQTLVVYVGDVQLALVVTRLFDGTPSSLARLLCKHVLACPPGEMGDEVPSPLPRRVQTMTVPDAFTRSMSYWVLGEPSRAASTLLNRTEEGGSTNDLFYFYTYLRTHPIVLRHRLASEGAWHLCPCLIRRAARDWGHGAYSPPLLGARSTSHQRGTPNVLLHGALTPRPRLPSPRPRRPLPSPQHDQLFTMRECAVDALHGALD